MPPTIAFNQPIPAVPPPQSPPQSQPYYPPPPQQHQPPPVAHTPPPHVEQGRPPQQQQQQYAPAHYQQTGQPAAAHTGGAPVSRRKSSRMPLIIGLIVVVLLGGAAAWYFLIYKKGEAVANSNANVANANANANTTANTNDNSNTTANANTGVPPYTPPPNSTQFVNTSAGLDGKLAENYSGFSFYYPNTWEKDAQAGVAGASNFVQVERRLPPDFTQENFAVSWYKSKGTFEADSEGIFEQAVALSKEKFSKTLPEFEVVSEGETTVNGIKGYEFRFQGVAKGTEKGDVTFWGRVVFLPPGKEGQTNGLQLLMLTTSLAPELTSVNDVGVKGELPLILNSFRMESK